MANHEKATLNYTVSQKTVACLIFCGFVRALA